MLALRVLGDGPRSNETSEAVGVRDAGSGIFAGDSYKIVSTIADDSKNKAHTARGVMLPRLTLLGGRTSLRATTLGVRVLGTPA